MPMKPSQLAKCLQHRVRLRPAARRFRGETELRIMDDDWLVLEVDEHKGARLRNIRTDHIAVLGFDQIRDYVADPKREYDGLRHGFLELKVQVYLRGADLAIEPWVAAKKAAAPRQPAAPRKRKTP